MKFVPFIFTLLLPFVLLSQLNGRITDAATGEPLFSVRVQLSSGQNTLTDARGSFTIAVKDYPVEVKFSLTGYLTDSVYVTRDTTLTIGLFTAVQEIRDVVVSASRSDQNIEEVPISMEIIRPALIDNKGLTNLEQVADQTPGVFAMDGQVSIRGGGGYAYGAGSRVLALWNGIPMTSPDVGDIKWNAIPLEQTSQVEIIKGASSVLYGSGALNGIIAMTEKEPGLTPEIKFKVQSGIYGDPRRSSLIWWERNPTFHLAEGYYGKQFGRVGFTMGFNGVKDYGYRQDETEDRARLNGSLSYRFKQTRLKAGLSYNFQYQKMGMFILWRSAEEAYETNSISVQRSLRLNVDPYIRYIDRKNNTHYLRTRYYMVSTGNDVYVYASAKAEMYYADYQFQHSFKKFGQLTLGITNNNNVVTSTVFKDHRSLNMASYAQTDLKFGRLGITAGLRLEYFRMDSLYPDSRLLVGKDTIPFYPVFRAGLNYALTEHTFLRASAGQGVRFPSVAERYVSTSNGSVVVVPNPKLNPEQGWSAEAGIKQVFKISKWKAMIDAVGFINEYNNMIEFNFGVFSPYDFRQLDVLGTSPDTADLAELGEILNNGFSIGQLLGFQAQNTERARITGVELSFNSMGKIKEVEVVSLLGYTYMNPVSLNTSPDYTYWSSDSSNMLKYRFYHLAKADVESTYKNVSFGISSRYSSFMKNIDRIFEEELPDGNYVLPGFKEYRENNQRGNLVFDLRMGYKFQDKYRVGFIVNNVFNAEYASRPADIQPPRNFIVQFQYHFQ
ncbi:MAG: TonB-dependent receptor [Bacteroidota bacterium]|jgi:outer membrane receptor protein involved in Fe transport